MLVVYAYNPSSLRGWDQEGSRNIKRLGWDNIYITLITDLTE
jgi:hypothetical protein